MRKHRGVLRAVTCLKRGASAGGVTSFNPMLAAYADNRLNLMAAPPLSPCTSSPFAQGPRVCLGLWYITKGALSQGESANKQIACDEMRFSLPIINQRRLENHVWQINWIASARGSNTSTESTVGNLAQGRGEGVSPQLRGAVVCQTAPSPFAHGRPCARATPCIS